MSEKQSTLAGSLLKKVIIAFVVLVCTTIIFTIALILELDDDWVENMAATSAMFALCFGVFVAAGVVLSRKHIGVLMRFSCVLAFVGTVLAVFLIWINQHYQENETINRIMITSLSLGIALAHSGVFSIVSTHTRLLYFTKIITMACLWVCAVLTIVLYWYEDLFWSMGGMFFMLMNSLALSTLASIIGSIIVPIAAVSHANKTQIENESISSRVKILMECPKCAKRQDLSSGNARCSDCNASIFIEIEEQRCECGYLLYKLQGEICPECGKQVPESERWAAC